MRLYRPLNMNTAADKAGVIEFLKSMQVIQDDEGSSFNLNDEGKKNR